MKEELGLSSRTESLPAVLCSYSSQHPLPHLSWGQMLGAALGGNRAVKLTRDSAGLDFVAVTLVCCHQLALSFQQPPLLLQPFVAIIAVFCNQHYFLFLQQCS